MNKLVFFKGNNDEILGMIALAKAWYYRNKDSILYEESLNESIAYAPAFVSNYVELGRYYLEQNEKVRGMRLISQGLDNVKIIYGENHCKNDFTDMDKFFNEFYKGTSQSCSNFESKQRSISFIG